MYMGECVWESLCACLFVCSREGGREGEVGRGRESFLLALVPATH